MSGFQVPFSSSLPSTPGSLQKRSDQNGYSISTYAAHPSTTPAGPPPSSAKSFTPVGHPPSIAFGSSQLGSGNGIFRPDGGSYSRGGSQRKSKGPIFKSVRPSKQPLSRLGHLPPPKLHGQRPNTFTAPGSSLLSSLASDMECSDEWEEADDDECGDSGENESELRKPKVHNEILNPEENGLDPHFTENTDEIPNAILENSMSNNFLSSAPYDWISHSASTVSLPRANGELRFPHGRNTSYKSPHRRSIAAEKRKGSALPAIAKNLASQLEPASLDDQDRLIIETENLVKHFYDGSEDREQSIKAALVMIPEALCQLWQSCCKEKRRRPSADAEFVIGLGPSENDPPLKKATFLSTLLLRIHHPPIAMGKQALLKLQSPGSTNATPLYESSPRSEALPKILLDWLEEHHNPYHTALIDLHTHHPNPTAHLNYWDLINSAILRGKLAEVVVVFNRSDFTLARTARDDEGQSAAGYHGQHLNSTLWAVKRATQVLRTCPAVKDGDWYTTGNDWTVFRKHVRQAITELASYAEGRDRDLDPAEAPFEAENFGIRSTSNALSRSARRAESKVPWTIYQNLKALYGLLLGGATEIMSFAQDWVEATIGLTVWWDGDDDDEIAIGSLAMARQPLRRSQPRIPRSVDEDPILGYRRRLAYAFDRVTDDSVEGSFQIDSMKPVEVGLASVFEGNINGALLLLRGWSLPIAAAVIDIAAQAGWLEPFQGDGMMGRFDQSDLMVLSCIHPEIGITRDGVLIEYAQSLFERRSIEGGKESREGWELAIQVLSKLNDTAAANREIGHLLARLPLDSDQRADKSIAICCTLSLHGEARDIANKYADSIAESSDKYGAALVYYARALNARKVKNVLDLLISYSLVQSVAYPSVNDLDRHMQNLIREPEQSLSLIGAKDPQAAELLQLHLSGYATLRKFYDLRDEEVNLQPGQKERLRPEARKKAAAGALLAVISSAADNIQGGLYDENSEAIVEVDGLLALLGEAMVFLNQPTRILTLPQIISLIRTIEDLQTVHPHIYAQCNECLQSTLAAAHSSLQPGQARELLKKSISSLTGNSMGGPSGGSGESSWVMASTSPERRAPEKEQKRGWDWRVGVRSGMKGDDILAILRLNLAKEVASAWIDGV